MGGQWGGPGSGPQLVSVVLVLLQPTPPRSVCTAVGTQEVRLCEDTHVHEILAPRSRTSAFSAQAHDVHVCLHVKRTGAQTTLGLF